MPATETNSEVNKVESEIGVPFHQLFGFFTDGVLFNPNKIASNVLSFFFFLAEDRPIFELLPRFCFSEMM